MEWQYPLPPVCTPSSYNTTTTEITTTTNWGREHALVEAGERTGEAGTKLASPKPRHNGFVSLYVPKSITNMALGLWMMW